MPEKLVRIEDGAFYGCKRLKRPFLNKKIKITFGPNGRTVKKRSKKGDYGKLPTPKRKNYIFVGWSTKKG